MSARDPATVLQILFILKGVNERQQRALALQAEVTIELVAALQEQGEALSQLLIPDTIEAVK